MPAIVPRRSQSPYAAESSSCEQQLVRSTYCHTTKVVGKDSELWGFALRFQPLLYSQVLREQAPQRGCHVGDDRCNTNDYEGVTGCKGCFHRFRVDGPAWACCCCEQQLA